MLLEYLEYVHKFQEFQNFKTPKLKFRNRIFPILSSLLDPFLVDKKQKTRISHPPLSLNFINLREIRRKTHGNASIRSLNKGILNRADRLFLSLSLSFSLIPVN